MGARELFINQKQYGVAAGQFIYVHAKNPKGNLQFPLVVFQGGRRNQLFSF